MHKQPLFEPIEIGALTLPNRVVMAPLTRQRAGEGAVPQPINAVYYRQRAGAGLIISEASQIDPTGKGYRDTPGIYNEQQVAGWRLVTDAVHDGGGRIFLQLWHVGRISHPDFQPEGRRPLAPSALKPEGHARTENGKLPLVTPRALTTAEVGQVVGQYERAAGLARLAGFDGVEIHGANGYLIDQFLRDGSNQRHDRYGGSVPNRIRFLAEVTAAVVDVWGAERVGVRLSPGNRSPNMVDSDPATLFSSAVSMLDRFDLAYLHLYESNEEGRRLTPLLRRQFNGPLMLNGGYDRQRANAAVGDGRAEMVAFGRAYIANPDLAYRLRHELPLNASDPHTFYGGGAEGYIDYPTIAADTQLQRSVL